MEKEREVNPMTRKQYLAKRLEQLNNQIHELELADRFTPQEKKEWQKLCWIRRKVIEEFIKL